MKIIVAHSGRYTSWERTTIVRNHFENSASVQTAHNSVEFQELWDTNRPFLVIAEEGFVSSIRAYPDIVFVLLSDRSKARQSPSNLVVLKDKPEYLREFLKLNFRKITQGGRVQFEIMRERRGYDVWC